VKKQFCFLGPSDSYEGTFGNKIIKKLLQYAIMGDIISPGNQGVFQLLKKETQPAIAREDWTTDGSVIMHQIEHHLSLTGEWMFWYK